MTLLSSGHPLVVRSTLARELESALDEARETLARLRQDLADPPADVQEAVLDKLNLRSVITERDEAREQLARIAKEAFDDQDTIGLEPYADYILRKLAEERTGKETGWQNKWQVAVDMAARASLESDRLAALHCRVQLPLPAKIAAALCTHYSTAHPGARMRQSGKHLEIFTEP